MDTSATQWTYEVHQLSEGYSAIVYDGNGHAVADHLSELHASLIVRAVNAHDDLVRQLSHLVRHLEPLERSGGLNVPGLATLNGARAALAKANGEQP